MANIKEKFESYVAAKKRTCEILDDATVLVKKIDLRSVSGGYKLIVTTQPIKEDE